MAAVQAGIDILERLSVGANTAGRHGF
jgi:hypothetical protein